jgi:FSR family fosmidomycin resistance protein-like MFS transporter
MWRAVSAAASLALPFLLVELFDEVSFGLLAPALPAIQAELRLTYAEVGLLLGLPGILNAFVEPVLLLAAEGAWRRRLIFAGGVALSAAWLAISVAAGFPLILAAAVLAYPASGAFVTLSQASLIEANPGREGAMMARWNAAGTLGSLLGPAMMTASLALGAGWRLPFGLLGAAGMAVTLWTRSRLGPPAPGADASGRPAALRRRILDIVRDRGVRRWILLLQTSDLMLDILIGYTGIYFTNVVGLSPATAALTLSGLTAVGLAADLALIRILDVAPGRKLVRVSALLVAALYPLFLILPGAGPKICLILVIRVLTAGWYPVLQAEAYAAADGRSAAMLALSSTAGVIGSGLAWLIGWLAALAGLPAAMWLLLLGPTGLIVFLPRGEGRRAGRDGPPEAESVPISP